MLLVHGWCCNRGFWDAQVESLSASHTLVRMDLPGHGASGSGRTKWTMSSFGEDVVAVVRHLGLRQVVLVGHSMGGPVIAEAARHIPQYVVGLIGVDTWRNLSQPLTPAEIAEFAAPLHANFVERMRAIVRSMYLPTSDPRLVERTAATMSAADPRVGVSAVEELFSHGRALQEALREITVPKITINSAEWRATDTEAARRYGTEVILMSGVGHFVMMEDPQTFNRLLHDAIRRLMNRSATTDSL